MKILQRLKPLLAQRLGVDEAEIKPERTLESFGIDSLARLELLFEIEEVFGIRLDSHGGGITTLGHVVSLVEFELGRLK